MSEDIQPAGLRFHWARSVIGDKTAPHDFAALDDSTARTDGRPILGPAEEATDAKDEAARECEAAYFRFVAALVKLEAAAAT